MLKPIFITKEEQQTSEKLKIGLLWGYCGHIDRKKSLSRKKKGNENNETNVW